MIKGIKIGIIGGGKMGGVLLQGIISHGLLAPADIIVADVDNNRLEELKSSCGIKVTRDAGEAVKKSNIVILAVKPQIMDDILTMIAGAVTPAKLVISIAAGISIEAIGKKLKKGVPIIRTMPNTPALVGEGITALAAGPGVTEEDWDTARQIFEAVGLTVEVQEGMMDAVTGLSGSGPAYGFTIIEALADGGVQMGLTREIALKLAAQTILGAARLVLAGDKHPGQLKDMVTSPGGTTIAGLRALEAGKIRATLMEAVEAATLRSKELGGRK